MEMLAQLVLKPDVGGERRILLADHRRGMGTVGTRICEAYRQACRNDIEPTQGQENGEPAAR
jgi:hypothetical protein